MKFSYKLLMLALLLIFCLFFIFPGVSGVDKIRQLKGKEPYNVILIIIDDLRPDHLGCYGYDKQVSPAIDRIAKDSVIFENAFSQAAYTLASTMSIFTSLYPSSHGVRFVFKDKLSPYIKTLPEIFELYGYRTGWFSLLKTPHLDIDVGFGRGFQDKGELNILLEGRQDIFSWLEKNKENRFFLAMDIRKVHDYFLFLRPVTFNGDSSQNKDLFEAMEEVEIVFYRELVKVAKSKKPPFDNPKIISEHKELFDGRYNKGKTDKIKKLVGMEERQKLETIRDGLFTEWVKKTARINTKAWIAAYDGCIRDVDKELIKPIEDELRAFKLYDKTIIIITADHGEAFGEHGTYGHGFKLYDEFNHVPLIIKIPYVKGGRRIKEIVESIDIMPTLLDLTGIAIPHQAQGKSLVALMTGKSVLPPHEYVFAETPLQKTIRSPEWKLIIDKDEGKRLFDLKADSQEQHNVYLLNRSVSQKLESQLKQWESSLPSYKNKEYHFSAEIDKAAQERIRKTGYW